MAAFVSSWGAVKLVADAQFVDLFLLVAFVLVLIDGLPRLAIWAPPNWIWTLPVCIPIVLLVDALWPVSRLYLNRRRAALTSFTYKGSPAVGPFLKGFQWGIALVVLPLIVVAITHSRREAVVQIIRSWTYGIAASAAIAVSDFVGATHVGLALNGFENVSGRQSGLCLHPNDLGVACALAVPFALYEAELARWRGTAVIALLISGAVLSGSRGGQASLVLAATFTLSAVRPLRRLLPRTTVSIGSILALLIFIQPRVLGRLTGFFRFSSTAGTAAEASNQGRQQLANAALGDFLHRPFFGIGLDYITGAHSVYLQLVSSGGVILAIGAIMYFGGALRSAWRGLQRGEQLMGLLFASILGWLAVGTVENQLTDRYLYFGLSCIAALEVARAGRSVEAPKLVVQLRGPEG